MKKYNIINTITGWTVFVVAAIVYLMTIEPTASFWDCGEFISAAYKLEVGHPPGAPFFMLVGNLFTIRQRQAGKALRIRPLEIQRADREQVCIAALVFSYLRKYYEILGLVEILELI